jgi:beta-galactosidase GanA
MQYNFEGRNDMIKFLKLVQDNNMYAVIRIGPFIQAEWNHGSVNVPKPVPFIYYNAANKPILWPLQS